MDIKRDNSVEGGTDVSEVVLIKDAGVPCGIFAVQL